MSDAPWFPLYANDLLSSTKVSLMTPAEVGAYVILLCHEWNDKACSLPDDDGQLAMLSRLNDAWKGSSSTLRNCFNVRGGRLVNPRLYEEWKKSRAWKEKCRKGGISSGLSRRNVAKGTSSLVATKSELEGNSSSSSSSSHSELIKELKTKKNKRPAIRLPDDFGLTDDRQNYALKKGLQDPSQEFEHFIEHHRKNDTHFVDWDAAWRTWVLNAAKWAKSKSVIPLKQKPLTAYQQMMERAKAAAEAAHG